MEVEYPNLSGLDPGALVDLYTFNHDLVRWEIYGTGHVNDDGSKIIPDPDPNHPGSRYGLMVFSWHMSARRGTPVPDPGGEGGCPCSTTASPVNLPTGTKYENVTDVSIGGARGGLTLSRVYNSELARRGLGGSFGLGWRSSFEISVIPSGPQNEEPKAWRLRTPHEGTGRLFSFVREEGGIRYFSTTATLSRLGDELRRMSNGTFEYRLRHGDRLMFDAQGRLTGAKDRNDNTTTLTYDAAGNLDWVEDPVGRRLDFTWEQEAPSGPWRIKSVDDPASRRWVYGYTGGRLTSVTGPDNLAVQYHYEALASQVWLLTTVIDKRGNEAKNIEYYAVGQNANGLVMKQTFADGGYEFYSYHFSGATITSASVSRVQPANGSEPLQSRRTIYRFNPEGYVIEMIDPLGQSVKIERDMKNQPVRTIGPCGCGDQTRTFDDEGNVLSIEDRVGKRTEFTYEPVYNNVESIKDRRGHTTEFEYYPNGNLMYVENAFDDRVNFGYDSFGQLTSIEDENHNVWLFEYDSYGNLKKITDPETHPTHIEYDPDFNRDKLGWPTAMRDALERRSTVVYDVLGRVLESRNTAGVLTRFTYDNNGNLRTAKDALEKVWTTTYDDKNRPITMEDPLARVTNVTYNAFDEVVQVVSPAPSSRTVKYEYDKRGDVTKVTDPRMETVLFAYDAYGMLTSITDQRANATTYRYDELHRPTAVRDPLPSVSMRVRQLPPQSLL
jgi:YD repeat-containing protein